MTSTATAQQYDGIPASARAAKRWMLHLNKKPFYVDGEMRNGTLDSEVDRSRMATFDQALDRFLQGGFTGLGFALGPDGTGNCWQGIDLDHISDHPELAELVHDLPGYVERSPSGNGVHAIGYGRNFTAMGQNGAGVEAYSGSRYFTVTGDTIHAAEPICLANYINSTLRPLHQVSGAPRNAPVAMIAAAIEVDADTLTDIGLALKHLQANADNYQDWTRVGMALKSLGAPGRTLFMEFSAMSGKFDAKQAERKWQSFNPNSITYRSILADAQALGWVNPASVPRTLALTPAPTTQQDVAKPTGRTVLALDSYGSPHATLSNAMAYLRADAAFKGRVWFCEFQQRVLSTFNQEQQPREWTDVDTTMLTEWFQTAGDMKKISSGITYEAVRAIAYENRRDECADWLNSLFWDGVVRVKDLFTIGFGAKQGEYIDSVSRCWMVSMVARALSPGCKVDTMPVFEGAQGRGKSQALQTLVGDAWFAESAQKPDSNDFFMALTGKLLVEIGEMDSFNKADVNAIKRVMSCKVDRYRPPYGRASLDIPRRSVFAGTTNRSDWNRDETGARRFWPVSTGAIDLEWIARNREQLFAEAVALFRAGGIWWDLPEAQARDEQESRRQADAWEETIGYWLIEQTEVTTTTIMERALGIHTGFQTRADQMRVASAMRVLGWVQQRRGRGAGKVRLWVRA